MQLPRLNVSQHDNDDNDEDDAEAANHELARLVLDLLGTLHGCARMCVYVCMLGTLHGCARICVYVCMLVYNQCAYVVCLYMCINGQAKTCQLVGNVSAKNRLGRRA